jgi:hypothetical protein
MRVLWELQLLVLSWQYPLVTFSPVVTWLPVKVLRSFTKW